MKVLAIDSSGKTAGVAVLSDRALLYESYLANGLTHSETLMPLIENAFSITALSPEDIDLYCVNAGPGSFTGLRIGMALVKGLALARNVPCVGVSTLEALAYSCTRTGAVIAALNARRGEVYHAAFRVDNGSVERVYEDSASHASELREFAVGIKSGITLMGDGAHIVKDALGDEVSSTVYVPECINGRAYGVGICGINMHQRGLSQSAEKLEISYCRLSQAERERENKNHE